MGGVKGEETQASCPLGSVPQHPWGYPSPSLRPEDHSEGPLRYPLRLAHRYSMSIGLGN